MQRRLLVVEDNDVSRQQLRQLLETEALQVDTVGDGTEALHALATQTYSIVLTDLKMPRGDGLQLIEEVQRQRLPVTVIVMTGFGTIPEAVQAMRLGAYDFLTKPLDLEHLRLVIGRALHARGLQDELAHLRDELRQQYAIENLLTKSPRMHAVLDLVKAVGDSTATVLIEGETGTGKEVVARALHQAGPRRTGPLIAVNCAALPETLLESELFGHEKGAFTSAAGQRRGRFELADGGTIFLDEVGDIPAAMQVKLLRVLQERRFERVGGSASIEVDVRVIAATHRSLPQLVEEGKFREDLYYRLNVIKIQLPALRERPEDIPVLAQHFAQKYARPGQPAKQLAPEALEALGKHPWPGNIRELENAIERACVTAADDVLRVENLPPEVVKPPQARQPLAITLDRSLADTIRAMTTEVERRYLRRALKRTRGNVARCAQLCGLSRRTITDKLAEHQLDKELFKKE